MKQDASHTWSMSQDEHWECKCIRSRLPRGVQQRTVNKGLDHVMKEKKKKMMMKKKHKKGIEKAHESEWVSDCQFVWTSSYPIKKKGTWVLLFLILDLNSRKRLVVRFFFGCLFFWLFFFWLLFYLPCAAERVQFVFASVQLRPLFWCCPFTWQRYSPN